MYVYVANEYRFKGIVGCMFMWLMNTDLKV